MSDLRTLHDAFDELERRADAAGTAPVARSRRAVRLVPVAATVVAVAVLAAGAVWLVPGDSGTHAAGPSPTASSSSAPVPTSPDDLIARFRAVLGDTATLEVIEKMNVPRASPSSQHSQQPGTGPVATPLSVEAEPGVPGTVFVFGTLTSADLTGGIALMVRHGGSEPGELCDLLRVQDVDVSTLPDGSRLTTGTAQPSPGAVSHGACLARHDGTSIVVHVSNQEDPAGAVVGTPGGEIYSPRPPLTLDQLKAIVTSDEW